MIKIHIYFLKSIVEKLSNITILWEYVLSDSSVSDFADKLIWFVVYLGHNTRKLLEIFSTGSNIVSFYENNTQV
jgi:hypothetical protein